MWPFNLSVRLLIVDLVGRYLTNYLIRREGIFQHIKLWFPDHAVQKHYAVLAVVSNCCPPTERQVPHALLTRPPLSHPFNLAEALYRGASFDLHVLGTPPAFVLSQDQTLNNMVS